MAEKPSDLNCEGVDPRRPQTPAEQAKAWFLDEVLPLEAALTRFLQRNWRNESDIDDFRQEIYAQVFQAAETGIPERTQAFLFSTARNLLIDRIRRKHIVPIDAVADLDVLGLTADEPGPERNVMARDVLRRLQDALDRLSPRCREAVILKRVEGFSRRQIAQRMGITEQTVADYVTHGMCILAEALFGDLPGRRNGHD
jgi:RNA polymerase sigma factor (sigma-70 family)